MSTPTTDIKSIVQEKYGEAARRAAQGQTSCGCGSGAGGCGDPITSNLYDVAQIGALPIEAVVASLGCGNPTALAELKAGETVLDLGSGGGIDVLLSARRVGPAGKAYGLDMTDDMLALARENQRKAGLANVEFLKGEIEHIPLPDSSVDVIISNCVINLSADKDAVLREAFRVLKPGGRFAVSDVVVRGNGRPGRRPEEHGALDRLRGGRARGVRVPRKLAAAGFGDVELEPTRIYRAEDAQAFLASAGLDREGLAEAIDGKFMSAFVRATKPAAAQPCCGPSCCS